MSSAPDATGVTGVSAADTDRTAQIMPSAAFRGVTRTAAPDRASRPRHVLHPGPATTTHPLPPAHPVAGELEQELGTTPDPWPTRSASGAALASGPVAAAQHPALASRPTKIIRAATWSRAGASGDPDSGLIVPVGEPVGLVPGAGTGGVDSDLGLRHDGQHHDGFGLECWRCVELLASAFLNGFSEATKAAYRADLADALRWLHAAGVLPLRARRSQLEAYAADRRAQGLSARTVARRMTALAGLFRYAVQDELLDRDPMLLVRRPRLPRPAAARGLDRDEARRLLAGAAAHSPRAAALVNLLLGTGLRVSAVVGCDVRDVTRGQQHVTLAYTNKGGDRAWTVLNAPVLAAVSGYLGGRGCGPLLLSRTGSRLDRTAATRLLQRVGALVLPERPDLTSRLCRAAFVTLSLDAGADLRDVADAAGHASPATTQLYDRARHQLARHPALLLAEMLRD